MPPIHLPAAPAPRPRPGYPECLGFPEPQRRLESPGYPEHLRHHPHPVILSGEDRLECPAILPLRRYRDLPVARARSNPRQPALESLARRHCPLGPGLPEFLVIPERQYHREGLGYPDPRLRRHYLPVLEFLVDQFLLEFLVGPQDPDPHRELQPKLWLGHNPGSRSVRFRIQLHERCS